MQMITRFLVLFAVLFTGLVSVGCSTGQLGAHGTFSESARFERPQVSARTAARELQELLAAFERELNCSREQLAILQSHNAALEDPQLPVAISILERRVGQFEESVADLSWRLNRAVVASSEGSMEDFSMTLRAAPELPQETTQDSRVVLKELSARFTQLKREIDTLVLNISDAELEQNRRGELARGASNQMNIDRERRSMLGEEFLKVGWRVELAQCAVNYRSKVDLTPLLIQPESESASRLLTQQ